MSEPFIAEIKIFAGNFAPRGWAFCTGQLLPLSQNTALFSIIGTFYGGDGRTNFQLPNMAGRAPVHQGTGPGLTPRPIGAQFGTATVTLSLQQIPNHAHLPNAATAGNPSPSPTDHFWGQVPTLNLYETSASTATMAASAVGDTGGGQEHNNMMPYLAMNFIIALTGIYPPRS